LLGSVLYNEFITAIFVDINADPLVMKADVDIAQKWKDLRDGAAYTYGTKNYRYDGLEGLLTPYIHSEWLLDNHDNNSTMGAVVAVVENSEKGDPSRIIAKHWNEFSDLVGGPDSCERTCGEVNTLWGFLFSKQADYADWLFIDPGFKNVYNI
jgi:hypothetical protein